MSTELLEKARPLPVRAVPAEIESAPRAVVPERPRPVRQAPVDDDDDDDEPGFFARYRIVLVLGSLLAGGAVWAFSGPSAPSAPAPVRKAAVPINITLPPPPPVVTPPPPPPPKIEQPREEQMEEQAPVVDEAPPEPEPDNSPPPLGTNNVGDGKGDSFGLGKAGAGSGNGGGRRLGGSGGSKWGHYASQVQNSIRAAMRRNSTTKSASLTVTARIWADSTGRVTRATLAESTGNAGVDAALRNDVLTGLQLESPPPPGMKMPINLRLTARPAR